MTNSKQPKPTTAQLSGTTANSQKPTSRHGQNDLPPAIVVLDHSNPVDFEREAMPLLGSLMIDYLRAEAARSKQTDTELMLVALGSQPALGGDVANAAGALFAARTDALSVWPEADLARAVETLQAINAAVPA